MPYSRFHQAAASALLVCLAGYGAVLAELSRRLPYAYSGGRRGAAATRRAVGAVKAAAAVGLAAGVAGTFGFWSVRQAFKVAGGGGPAAGYVATRLRLTTGMVVVEYVATGAFVALMAAVAVDLADERVGVATAAGGGRERGGGGGGWGGKPPGDAV